MSEFSRPLAGVRLVDVLHGDTLQEIAAREIGDASRWVDIANINNLEPPYITDDAAQATDRVLLSGGVLLVPARPKQQLPREGTTEADLYGVDLALVDGQLRPNEDGDLQLVSGRENLKQALVHRVTTERGELLWHRSYGSLVRSLIGATNGPSSALLAAQYVAAAMRADYRVRDVNNTLATVTGDEIHVECEVVPIVGRSQKIEAII